VLERSGDGQDMKIQAKDSQQSGLFQMELEPGTIESDTLGPDFTYTAQPPAQDPAVGDSFGEREDPDREGGCARHQDGEEPRGQSNLNRLHVSAGLGRRPAARTPCPATL
jgi:hypothetical protein